MSELLVQPVLPQEAPGELSPGGGKEKVCLC